jgi:hypothetical protein
VAPSAAAPQVPASAAVNAQPSCEAGRSESARTAALKLTYDEIDSLNNQSIVVRHPEHGLRVLLPNGKRADELTYDELKELNELRAPQSRLPLGAMPRMAYLHRLKDCIRAVQRATERGIPTTRIRIPDFVEPYSGVEPRSKTSPSVIAPVF